MLELFPEGFAQEERGDLVELAAFTDRQGAERLRAGFGEVAAVPVAPGWAEKWKRFHRPVQVGPLWIGPPWEQPKPGLEPVVIDPGRAFGTGAHPTTQLCIELLLELERGSVVDIGCGSGVLAIAACRLGYEPVLAIDADEAAVEATTRNAVANAVNVDVRRLDALCDEIPAAELVIANIDLPTLHALRPPSECRRLVTSGYFESEQLAVPGFRHLARVDRAGWAADLFGRE
jgi:ribosomal protein L11 methyltransferase